MAEHIVFIPGVGAREWAWQHQMDHLADVATSEVMVLDQQVTRRAMADHVLAHAPAKFSLAGHSLGGPGGRGARAGAGRQTLPRRHLDARERRDDRLHQGL